MKFIAAEDNEYARPLIELTRRNLEILLLKLDDPLSARTIIKDGHAVRAIESDDYVVRAEENDEHYQAEGRIPGEMFDALDRPGALMAYSVVDQSHQVPCPACEAQPGEQCWPRAADDAPWVHKDRSRLLAYVLENFNVVRIR